MSNLLHTLMFMYVSQFIFSSFMTSCHSEFDKVCFLTQGLDLTLFHQRLEVVEVSVVHLMEIQVPLLIYHVLGFSCLSLQPLWLSPSRVRPRQHHCTFFKPCFGIIIFYCFQHTYWLLLYLSFCLNKVRINFASIFLIIYIFLLTMFAECAVIPHYILSCQTYIR